MLESYCVKHINPLLLIKNWALITLMLDIFLYSHFYNAMLTFIIILYLFYLKLGIDCYILNLNNIQK